MLSFFRKSLVDLSRCHTNDVSTRLPAFTGIVRFSPANLYDHVLTTAPDRVFVCIAKIIVFVQSPPIVTAAKIKHLYAFDYTNVRPRLAVRNVFSLEAGPDLCP